MKNTRAKPGRRSRYATPSPSTSFSASVEELVFLILLGHGALSAGVQEAVRVLVETSDEAAGLMAEARRLIALAEQNLERDEFGRVPQRDTYLYISRNYWQLVGE